MPPKHTSGRGQSTSNGDNKTSQRDQSIGRNPGQPAKLPKRTSSISKKESFSTNDQESHISEQKEASNQSQPTQTLKPGVPRLPPQNVKPVSRPKVTANTKLAKLPGPSKPSLRPMEVDTDSQGRSTLRSEAAGSIAGSKPAEDKPVRHQAIDAQVYKLMDKVKRLTENNGKLTQENCQMKAELGQFKANLPLFVQSVDWSKERDRVLKGELLRLRAENYKLRSSSQLNERFGELLSKVARDCEMHSNQCLQAVQEGGESEKRAMEVLTDVMSGLFRLSSSLQNSCRDYTSLREEQGMLNTREWDCNFGNAEVHSTQVMTEKVCSILLDLETTFAESLAKLPMKDLEENGILKSYHQLVIESSRALIEKSITLSCFIPTKKTHLELKKKLKGLSTLNLADAVARVESKVAENIDQFSNLTADLHAKLMSADLEAFFKLRSQSDPQLALCRMSGMILSLDKICTTNKIIKKTEAIEAKLGVYLKRFDQDIGEWVRELINFLDRTGLCYEVYLGYRHKILSSLEKFFVIEPDDCSGWSQYLEELRDTTRSCLVEFSKA